MISATSRKLEMVFGGWAGAGEAMVVCVVLLLLLLLTPCVWCISVSQLSDILYVCVAGTER